MRDCRKIWQDQLISVNSFCKLTVLRIVNCDSLEEIIESQGLIANESQSVPASQSLVAESAAKFVFPRTRYLRLVKLPKLTSFCSRMHATEWPSLKRMYVVECHKIETFASVCPLFGTTQAERQLQISNKQPLFWVNEV